VGQRYQLVMRAVYAPALPEADEAGVRAHVGSRVEEARKSATPPGQFLVFRVEMEVVLAMKTTLLIATLLTAFRAVAQPTMWRFGSNTGGWQPRSETIAVTRVPASAKAAVARCT